MGDCDAMPIKESEKEVLLFKARAIRGTLEMQRGFLSNNLEAAKMNNKDALRIVSVLIEQIEKLEVTK